MAMPHRFHRTRQRRAAVHDVVNVWLIVSQGLVLAASPFLFASIPSLLLVGRDGRGLYSLGIVLGWILLPLGTAACFIQAWQKFRENKFETAALLTTLPVVMAMLWLLASFA